jgi:DNA-binding response OmpR family regulator
VAKVLVVDDEAEVRGYLRRVLEKLGHEVWEAPDGTGALQLLETIPFGLVITDAYMAEVDGMELLVRIQQRGLHMPVLMISGGGYMAREDVLAMGKSCGAVATLEKPFSLEQLRATIEPLLRAGSA